MAYVVEEFRLDPGLFELTGHGERIALEPQAFDVLIYLVRHRDRVVSKEELMDSIWGGRFVTEAAVTSRIKQVRKALGDDGEAQRLIRTVHGRGYRFVGPIDEEDSPPPPVPPVSAVPSPGRTNLVGSVSRLLGREAELAAVTDSVEQHRLVTILGPGGIGKTRLALEAARSRSDADGPWFVELAGLSDGSLLPETVATALSIPSAVDIAALTQVLQNRRFLLVLDNCEHIADDVASFVAALLERCPEVRVLATSRQTLGAPGEHVFELAPLAQTAAEELFVERAGAVLRGWTPDADERSALGELCRGLDYLPLAIELAAAQCRALSVAQLAEQLSDRFALLSGGRRGNSRHASMAAAVAWSYDSLNPAERDLFEALCLFEGSFDLDGVRAVAGEQTALPILLSLIDKSLVGVLPISPRRYRILETLREYAASRRSSERTQQGQQEIVSWVSSVAQRAEVELYGPDSRAWMERLDHDKDTIRAALAWAGDDPPTQLHIAVGLMWFWYRRGHTVEALRALEPLSAAGAAAEPQRAATLPGAVRLRGAVGVVLLCYLAGDYPRLPAELDHARALAATTDDELARSYALATIAYFEAGSGQTEQALLNSATALEIARRLGSNQFASFALLTMGTAYLRTGALAEAQQRAAEGVRYADACGYSWGAVAASWIEAKARIAAGDLSEATRSALARVIADSAANRDLTSWLVGLISEAYVFLHQGLAREAAELVGIASRQGQQIGFAPEAMDPVETRRFLEEIMRAVQQRSELRAAYDEGRALDTDQAFARVAELLESRPSAPR